MSTSVTKGTDRETHALIVARAALGRYEPDVLRLELRDIPPLEDGELRIRVLYLSLDPTNRNWMKLEPVNTLVEKIGRNLAVGSPMVGEVLARVELSRSDDFAAGDIVAGIAEWQETAVVPAARMRVVDRVGNEPLTTHLTIFSHIGLAAMAGLYGVARIQAGETVLVSAAGGATGRLAVGIAKARGCRVVGIAGGQEKCAAVLGYGADAAIDYKNAADLEREIAQAAPEGVDVYFDNVGGRILDAALLAMSPGGRIAVCGLMSDYDAAGERHGLRNMFQVLVRHLRIEGYLAAHYWPRSAEYFSHLRRLLDAGLITHRVDEAVGLEAAPRHLATLFQGSNDAKLVVRLPMGNFA